jgi:hypothetical protein
LIFLFYCGAGFRHRDKRFLDQLADRDYPSADDIVRHE